MPRVSQKEINYAWMLSLVTSIIVGVVTLLFFYLPFLETTFSHPVTRFPGDTITNLSYITLINFGFIKVGSLNFGVVKIGLDIMDMTFLTLLLFFIFPAYVYRKDFIWRRRADNYLPYLLREISDAQKVGLPLPRAVLEASKRQYGPLTEELRIMAAKVSWGIPFGTCLRTMSESINTSLFRRTSVLILEAERSGGQADEIFDSAYIHVTDLLGLERERLSSMSPYKWIIFIAFLVFAFIMVVLLNSFFVELVKTSTNTLGATSSNTQAFGGLPMNLALLQLIFFHILLIEGSFSGIISGKMSTGNIKVGMVQTIILITLAYLIFKIGSVSI